ncbi:MAG: DUF3102 domain-containing protein [Rhodovulum sp.]|nr:DUF3102 domain-containing protein [Rhodovulum sp.]
MKAKLPHGGFMPWIEAEFGMTDQSARRFMQVAERYGKSNIMLDLTPTALFELAAPSTPEPVRELVEAKAEAGERVAIARAIAGEIEERRGRPSRENPQEIAEIKRGQETRDFAAKKAGFGKIGITPSLGAVAANPQLLRISTYRAGAAPEGDRGD